MGNNDIDDDDESYYEREIEREIQEQKLNLAYLRTHAKKQWERLIRGWAKRFRTTVKRIIEFLEGLGA